jgi:hypothetical protein
MRSFRATILDAAPRGFDRCCPPFTTGAPGGRAKSSASIAQNSNLRSHLIRAQVAPREAVEGGVMFYRFTLDQPASLAPRVTSADLAFEFDTYIDWKINARFTASFVGAFANPGAAIQQAFGRTQNFVYGMAFLSYSY